MAAPKRGGPGVFNSEAIPKPPSQPDSHHSAGCPDSTTTADTCACCRAGLHRAESRAAGICLACRITADELAVI